MGFTIAGPNARPIDVPTFLAALHKPLEELKVWKIEQLWADPQSPKYALPLDVLRSPLLTKCCSVISLVVTESEGKSLEYIGCALWGDFPEYVDESGRHAIRDFAYPSQAAFVKDLPHGAQNVLEPGAAIVFPQFK